MEAMMKTNLMTSASNRFRAYLATGVPGYYTQGRDRLNEAGIDVDLRREATEANARALLWVCEDRRPEVE